MLCVLAITVGACEDTGTDDGDNRTPVVSFGAPVMVTMENISPLRLAVVLSKPAVSPVSVKIGVKSEGGAKEGVNYRIVSKELQIAKGASTAYIEIELVDDIEQNADRIFELEIVSATGATVSDKVKTCRVTIQSDEGYPTVGFAEALVSVAEEGVSHTLPVTLNRKAEVDMTFTLKAINGSAVEDEHFTLPIKEFTIAKGDSVAYVEIGIVDDDIVNDNRIFELEIAGATNAVVSEIYNKCKITIVNDERLAYVSFDQTNIKFYESEGKVSIPVSVSGDPNEDVVIQFAVKAGGSAIEGTHFNLPGKTLTLPKGTKKSGIQLELINDNEVNPDRTFQLEILSVTGALKADKDTLCNITILNEDMTAEQRYEYMLGEWTATHNAGSFTFTITGGDTPEEESANYLKKFVCKGLHGKSEAKWSMTFDKTTQRISIVCGEIVIRTLNFGDADGKNRDIIFEHSNNYAEFTPITSTWSPDYQTVILDPTRTWAGVLYLNGVRDPGGRAWFIWSNTKLTKNADDK